MTEVLDVLVVGGVGVDTIVRVPSLPVGLVDTLHVPPIERYVGHTGSGWALGLHRLGLQVELIDLVGADSEADFVAARFRRDGLPFVRILDPAGTKRSVNLVDMAGQRTSFYDGRGQGVGGVDPALWEAMLARARHVHVSTNDWTRPVLRAAVGAGCPASTDLHDWDGASAHHEEYALSADLVFFSAAETMDRTESLMRSLLRRGRAHVVVATAGADGAYVLERGGTVVHVPAVSLPDRPVVDSNGAGDAFGAGFLWAWLGGLPAAEAARRGAIAGAYACSTPGTHADPITGDQLLALAGPAG